MDRVTLVSYGLSVFRTGSLIVSKSGLPVTFPDRVDIYYRHFTLDPLKTAIFTQTTQSNQLTPVTRAHVTAVNPNPAVKRDTL